MKNLLKNDNNIAINDNKLFKKNKNKITRNLQFGMRSHLVHLS